MVKLKGVSFLAHAQFQIHIAIMTIEFILRILNNHGFVENRENTVLGSAENLYLNIDKERNPSA